MEGWCACVIIPNVSWKFWSSQETDFLWFPSLSQVHQFITPTRQRQNKVWAWYPVLEEVIDGIMPWIIKKIGIQLLRRPKFKEYDPPRSSCFKDVFLKTHKRLTEKHYHISPCCSFSRIIWHPIYLHNQAGSITQPPSWVFFFQWSPDAPKYFCQQCLKHLRCLRRSQLGFDFRLPRWSSVKSTSHGQNQWSCKAATLFP